MRDFATNVALARQLRDTYLLKGALEPTEPAEEEREK